MPTAPLQPCVVPGCPALVSAGRCATHHRQSQAARDATRRTSAARGYQSRAWRAFRLRWLSLHPLCGARLTGPSAEHSLCVRLGRVTYAAYQQVDHIRPVTGPDDPRFLDEGEVQTLCRRCHSTKTASEEGAFGR